MSNSWWAPFFWYEPSPEVALNLPIADANGQIKEDTVIRVPAFASDVFHLNTRLSSARSGSASTVCFPQADSVLLVPRWAKSQALVPSILPVARVAWESPPHQGPHRASAGSRFHPQPRALSITLVRRWQTRAVDPERNGRYHVAFDFTVPCEFQLLLNCCLICDSLKNCYRDFCHRSLSHGRLSRFPATG